MSSVRRLLSGIASIMMMIIGGRITIMLVLARRTMIMRRSSVAVMPEGHANAGAYGRKALDGNGQDQHGKGKRAEQALEHRTGLYVRSLERRSHESVPPSGLLLAAHAARRFIKRDAVRIAPEYPRRARSVFSGHDHGREDHQQDTECHAKSLHPSGVGAARSAKRMSPAGL